MILRRSYIVSYRYYLAQGLSTISTRLTSRRMSAEPAPDRRPAPDRLVEAAAPTPPGVPSASPPSASHVAEQIVHLARLVHGGASDQCLTPAQWTALRYFARANRFSRTPSAFSEFHATTRGTA